MPHTGPNAGIRYAWALDEDGWDVEQNEDNRKIDALIARAVKDRGLNTPPGSPSDGDRYIVGTSPTGAWASKANQIALYDGNASAWVFYVPKKGWDVFVDDEGATYKYNGTTWWLTSGEIEAAMFTTTQAAADAAAAIGGCVVKLPPGTISSGTTPSFAAGGNTAALIIQSNIILEGAGELATTLDMTGQSTSKHAIKVEGSNVTIRNLHIQGQAADGTGHGILVGDGGDPQRNVWIVDCWIEDTPSWAVYFEGTPGDDIVILSGIQGGTIYDTHTNGAVYAGPGCTTIYLLGVNMPCSADSGPIVKFEGVVDWIMSGCSIEPATDSVLLEIATGGLFIRQAIIENNYFETHNSSATPKWMIEITGATGQQVGLTMRGNKFNRYPEGADKPPRILRVTATNVVRSIIMDGNTVRENRSGSAPTDDISIETAAHEVLLRDNTVWDADNAITRALTITTASGGSTAAVINCDWKLFQAPRHAAANEGNLPAVAGMIYYDTTNNKLRVYKGGTGWVDVATG
jgi:hypothetical protein